MSLLGLNGNLNYPDLLIGANVSEVGLMAEDPQLESVVLRGEYSIGVSGDPQAAKNEACRRSCCPLSIWYVYCGSDGLLGRRSVSGSHD